MAKKKSIWTSDGERAAWDAHVDETIRNLRELAAKGRAELGLPPVSDYVAQLRELTDNGPSSSAA